MLGKYYYGEIVRCVKSGYNVTISENGEKDVKFTYPILRDLRGAILRKEKGPNIYSFSFLKSDNLQYQNMGIDMLH